jgi:hypothetical protein
VLKIKRDRQLLWQCSTLRIPRSFSSSWRITRSYSSSFMITRYTLLAVHGRSISVLLVHGGSPGFLTVHGCSPDVRRYGEAPNVILVLGESLDLLPVRGGLPDVLSFHRGLPGELPHTRIIRCKVPGEVLQGSETISTSNTDLRIIAFSDIGGSSALEDLCRTSNQDWWRSLLCKLLTCRSSGWF